MKLTANSSCSSGLSPSIKTRYCSQRFVEPTGLGSAHRQDDLCQRLDRSVGIGLEILPAQLFGLGEPVALDRLVEERGVGLVAIVGLGILVQVLGQIVDQRTIVIEAGSRRHSRLAARRGLPGIQKPIRSARTR